MGAGRKFDEVKGKIPCFKCPAFEMSEGWNLPYLYWSPYCWKSKNYVKTFYEKCPHTSEQTVNENG